MKGSKTGGRKNKSTSRAGSNAAQKATTNVTATNVISFRDARIAKLKRDFELNKLTGAPLSERINKLVHSDAAYRRLMMDLFEREEK